ncbi:hypothetical protein BC835DRAFT_1420083 [Cytidiella melzeri]|nr:hypothetical protein BC835DRAFT_1420083 [Cytidiella melzeri]
MAAPSWDPSGAFFAELPVGRREFARNRIVGLLQMVTDHFKAYFRKWDPASPSLLIASTQAHRHIEASTFIRGTVSDMASSVSQIRSDMAKLRSERRLRFQQEHMKVDNEALPSYARLTKVSAAKGPGPKAKKTLDSIYEGGAASEAEEIMTPGARRSTPMPPKRRERQGAGQVSVEGMHPSVALSHRQRQAAAAKKAAASAPHRRLLLLLCGRDQSWKRPRADSTHTTERPDTPSTAAPPAKKLQTADDWFKSLSVEMINNFALGLRVLGPTAVDFSIDQILATGQRMGSFGFPIEGVSTPAARDKGKGKIVVPGTHPANDTKPDARANLSADEGSIRKEEEVRAIVARLYHRWQLAEHEKKGGATTTLQLKLNPVIRVKWDEKRRNQLQLAFQVHPELNFVNWLEDVWTKMTAEDIAGYPLSSSYPPVLLVHMYTSMAELVIQACPSKDLSIQDIFAEMSRNNPEVFQHLVPSNYTPVAFWGAGHRKGSPGPLHIFAYDVGGEVAQRLIQERVTIGSKKCSLVLAQSTARVAMCTHCHRIGHWRDQCKNGAFEWCKVCPANHRTEDHNEVAPCCIPTRERLQTETWPCPNEHWICANCGKTGHGHYSNRCSRYSKRGDKAYMQGVDPATQLRRDVPAVPCKAGRQLDNNATKSANRAIRTQKKRAEEAAAALIAAKDHEGNVPMRESTPVAGPSTQRKRVKSGRYEALSEVAETSEDDVEIIGAGASEIEDGQHE